MCFVPEQLLLLRWRLVVAGESAIPPNHVFSLDLFVARFADRQPYFLAEHSVRFFDGRLTASAAMLFPAWISK